MASSEDNGYESVPDVENGASGAPQSYAELPDNQAELMANFDSAAGLSSMGFEMPQADPNELMDHGKSMIMSALQPTVSAVGTFAVGYWMALQAQYSAAAALIVMAYPYINATIQFVSSIKPLQDKLMSAIEPIFAKKEKVEDDVAEGFQNISRKVDKTVDELQEKTVSALDPIRPELDEASAKMEPLKRLDPDLDIPDVGDIDDEFDEAQGKVGDRVDSAQAQLTNVNQYLPVQLHSAKNFYWRVVFPVLLTALLLQLCVAFITTYSTQQKEARASAAAMGSSTETNPARFLRGSRGLYDIADATSAVPVDAVKSEAVAQVDQSKADAQEAIQNGKDAANQEIDNAKVMAQESANQAAGQIADAKDAASAQLDQSKADALDAIQNGKDMANQEIDNAKAMSQDAANQAAGQVDDAKAAISDKADELKGQFEDGKEMAKQQAQAAMDEVTGQVDAAKAAISEKSQEIAGQVDDAKQQAQEAIENGKKEAEEKAEEIKASIKPMIISTITSWLMSMLQMGLVFLFTSPKVKAWIVNKMTESVKDEANRRLRATGVPDMLHDVLVVRMGKIKKKLYRVFSMFGRVKKLLDKLKGFSNIPGADKLGKLGNVSDKASNVMGKIDSKKLSFGGFGRK